MAATRATLELVLTDDAFAHMCELGHRFASGIGGVIERRALPWCMVELERGRRYGSARNLPRAAAPRPLPRTTSSTSCCTSICATRILITPFHNMSLMCPATSEDDVDRHVAAFDELATELRV